MPGRPVCRVVDMVKVASVIARGMGFHTFDVARASDLEEERRYRFCSREELLALVRPDASMVVADLGSGTGFYADEVAPYARRVFAVDKQRAMHEFYREKGVPGNVSLVTAGVGALPFGENALDAAFSVDTYHEFHSAASLDAIGRVVRPGGQVVTVDWSSRGEGAAGPPLDERFSLAAVVGHFADAGFRIVRAEDRLETFVCVARR